MSAYGNSLRGTFTFDDVRGIIENESIRTLWPLTVPLAAPSNSEPVAGRPVINLSFALNYAMDGLEPRGYHFVNVVIHILTGLAMFGLARRTLERVGWVERGPPIAFAGSLIWLVHPLTTEAVDYVSQRTELLFALFCVLTLYAALRAATEPGRRWPAIAVVACALGMACKETMVVTPLLVVLYDRLFLYSSLREALKERRSLYAGLALSWVFLAMLIRSGPRWETAGFSAGVSPWSYLINQCVILVEYLRRTIWPVSMVLDYGEPRALALRDVIVPGLLILALLTAAVVALAKWPRVGFLLASFFIVLAPTSSVIPIATEVGAERRVYLPLAAVAFIVALGLDWLWRVINPRAAWAGLVASALVLAVPLAGLTSARNAEYRSERLLWKTTLDRWPQARAHRNYATLLKREGFRDEVLEHLRLSLDGTHPEGRYGLGVELFEQERNEEAVRELRQYLTDVPQDPMVKMARGYLGDALLRLGRYPEAAVEYGRIVKDDPSFAKAWSNLGVALAHAGDHEQGLAALRRAVDIDPRDAISRRNLVATLIEDDLPVEALPHAQAAVQLDPENAPGRLFLAVALSSVNRIDEAVMQLKAALSLNPDFAEAQQLLTAIENLPGRKAGVAR